jgi:hypothetical protein
MAQPLADHVLRKIGEVCSLYHRLTLMVGPAGSGKTSALQEVLTRASAPLVNINLELTSRMLDLTERRRALQLPRPLQGVCASGDVRNALNLLLLDNIEIILDVELKLDTLRLLQAIPRNKTIVASWPGQIVNRGTTSNAVATKDARRATHDAGRYLTYAVPDHPEYRRYPIRDFLVASPEVEEP